MIIKFKVTFYKEIYTQNIDEMFSERFIQIGFFKYHSITYDDKSVHRFINISRLSLDLLPGTIELTYKGRVFFTLG